MMRVSSRHFAPSRSAAAWTMFMGCRVIITLMGASIEVTTICEDEPMWRHTTVPSSVHACQKGSQWGEWKLGQPSFSGFSENVTAWQPLADVRRISSAIRFTSHSGMIDSGMMRPG